MRKEFFKEFEGIDMLNVALRVPKDYAGYLRARYGENWLTPDSEWNYLSDDPSILGSVDIQDSQPA